jgi:hypothetical protein
MLSDSAKRSMSRRNPLQLLRNRKERGSCLVVSGVMKIAALLSVEELK